MHSSRSFCLKTVINNYRKVIKTSVVLVNKSTMSADHDWKGAPISNIIGSQSPWGTPEFPLVQPAYNHTVLYHIPGSGGQLDRPPKPQIGHDKWDSEHVRMPFSKQSLYPVMNSAGEKQVKNRWDMVQTALSKPIRNSKELANAILSYNTQFKGQWKFRALHELFNEHLEADEAQYFFDVTLPEVAKLALALPKLIQSPIPLLKQHKNRSISLSQQQISSLLANAFFCTFPRRNTTKRDSEYASYPFINFYVLYEVAPSDQIMEKLKCICHYFRRVCTKVPVGVVTVSRRSVAPNSLPKWDSSDKHIANLPLHVDPKETIEDAHGLIQVDFANKFLGGGVLGYGCVQEEIRFMICPELIISMLFTESLRPNEALMIIGCERYSSYTGYGSSFQWTDDYVDTTPYDSSGRRRVAVLAIDALPLSNKLQEHKPTTITRELNKAWVGFSFYTTDDSNLHHPGVATGNWGCGAFGGSAPIKSLIQMMALTQAGRPMAYYTFGDNRLRDDIMKVYNLLVKHNLTVGQTYKLLLKFCKTDISRTNIYTYLEEVLERKENSKPEIIDISAELKTENVPVSNGSALADSPDLFSQDEDILNEFASSPIINITSTENRTDNITIDLEQNNTSEYEKADTSKRASQIERLFVEMGKIDEDSKLNKTSMQKIDDGKTVDKECKMSTSECESGENNRRCNQTDRLFGEMEKLDEDSGKLNLKSPQKPFFGQKSNSAIMEVDDRIHSELSPDVKKKITKKITDYFQKMPI